MTGLADILRFWILRRLERVLPVDTLHRALGPIATVRSTLHYSFKRRERSAAFPDCIGPARPAPTRIHRRRTHYLNRTVELFPERLSSARWRERCRISGLDHLQRACEKGKPVLLAFCHVGAYAQLGLWLRSFGFPAATLVRGTRAERRIVRRLMDRLSPFPNLPTVLYQDELASAVRFLESGHVLLVALDADIGKQMEAPVQEGWTFRMATGAIRMAIRHQAELIPCSIIDEGQWRFRIELGEPVPREFLAGNEWTSAGEHLIKQLLPHIRRHPEQCLSIFSRFRKSQPP